MIFPLSARSTSFAEEWAARNPRSAELHRRAARTLPGGVAHAVRQTRPFPLFVERATGARKWDADGHELLCYVMGHGALLLGHGHPAVADAVARQAERGLHLGACHEAEALWAEQVSRIVPSAESVRFTSSGTEATMLALRLARAATGRDRVVALEDHFHGWHDYAAVGLDVRPLGVPAAVRDSVVLVEPTVVAVERALVAGGVAAVVLEPASVTAGLEPLPRSDLEALRRLTREHGALLVFDEVVSGFRVAPGGVQAEAGVVPDLTALAKILAGGMPGGAVAGLREVLSLVAGTGGGVTHSGTHNAHPLAAAAGTVTLELAADGSAQRLAADRAARLRAALRDVLEARGVAGEVVGASSYFRIELAGSEHVRFAADDLLTELTCGMLLHGVHLHGGASGLVSTAHGELELEQTVEAFEQTLAGLFP
jgi:glutamate-1-semialdehyde 2,1-aminomutase